MRKKKGKNRDDDLFLDEIPENPNLIISIRCSKIEVEVNSAIYSKDDAERIRTILRHMKDHIYIDKTYVNYKGSRWNTGFIIEDRWYKINRLILETDFGNNAGQKINDFILGTLEIIAETYLYIVLQEYGYDTDYIEISFPEDCSIGAEYEVDTRTSWEF